jgi:hypothetical protein
VGFGVQDKYLHLKLSSSSVTIGRTNTLMVLKRKLTSRYKQQHTTIYIASFQLQSSQSNDLISIAAVSRELPVSRHQDEFPQYEPKPLFTILNKSVQKGNFSIEIAGGFSIVWVCCWNQ